MTTQAAEPEVAWAEEWACIKTTGRVDDQSTLFFLFIYVILLLMDV